MSYRQSLAELAAVDLDLACIKERNNHIAVGCGLPPIGSTLKNAHGIEWVVDGHTYAPSLMTLGKTVSDSDPIDLYPVSIPQNLSPKLEALLQELSVCTPKEFVPLDTVPHLRPDHAMPYSHSVDSVSDPERILLYLDAARIHEAAFAHELAHVWLELVEGIEDYRVLEDLSDAVRYGQVQRIQSFVLDFRVNDFIRSRGFDTSDLENDRFKSLEQLSIAVTKGYTPPSRWESVVMAMLLAEVFVESQHALAEPNGALERIRHLLAEEWELAEGLAKIIRDEPRSSAESARCCIDRALTLCFAFAYEHLDLEKDLVEKAPEVHWRDKWPEWLVGLMPQQKAEIGKAQARSGLGSEARCRLLNSAEHAAIQFSGDGQVWTEPAPLPFRFPDPATPHDSASRIMQVNEQNRRRQMEQFERMCNPSPGRRAYATGEARFITQVRMEEWLAGEHPYAYGLSNPITNTDPSGNAPCDVPPGARWPIPMGPASPCDLYPGGPCEYAKHVGADKGDGGGVVCCDGTMYACDWLPPTLPYGVHKCANLHEHVHFPQSAECPGFGFNRDLFKSGEDRDTDECLAYNAEFACLMATRASDCGSMTGVSRSVCLELYRRRMRDLCLNIKHKYHCPESQVPAYCGIFR